MKDLSIRNFTLPLYCLVFLDVCTVFYFSKESNTFRVGTGQLVPKSTRTLVNSYPFMANSYLSQLVPKSTRTLVYL